MQGHAQGRLSASSQSPKRPSQTIHLPLLCLQVSFYRENLRFSVIAKQYGQTEDGKPLPLESLAAFIRSAS